MNIRKVNNILLNPDIEAKQSKNKVILMRTEKQDFGRHGYTTYWVKQD